MTRLKRNIYFVAIGQVSQKLLAFVLIPFAARGLGDSGFGRYSLASTLMFVVVLLNDWGMNTYVTREIARQKDRFSHLFWNTLFLKVVLILVDYAILMLYLEIAGYDAETNGAVLIFAGYGIISSIVQLSIAVFEAFERMEFEAAVFTIEKVLITAAGLYVLKQGYGLMTFCAVFGFGGLVSLVLCFLMIRSAFPIRWQGLSAGVMKRILLRSLPFGFSLIFATIYNTTGVFILSLQETPREVGWFSAGFKLVGITNLIPYVISAAIYPALSNVIHRGESGRVRDLHIQGVKFLYFLALPMIAGGMMLSDKLIGFFFGQEFIPAVPVLRIMVWKGALVFFNLYFTGVLKAANFQKQMVRLQGAALVLNIGLNLVLISLYSYQGAAYTGVITESFIFITYLRIIQTRVCRISISDFWLKGLAATGVLALFVYFLGSIHVTALIGGGMLVYFAVLYAIKGFTFAEILPFTRPGGEAS